MTPLDPAARALIEDAAGVDSPGPADKERVRARLAMALGTSVVGAVATTAAVKGVSASVAKGAGGVVGTSLAMKLIAALTVVSAVGLGYVAGRRSDVDAGHAVPTPPAPLTGRGALPLPVPPSPPAAAEPVTQAEPSVQAAQDTASTSVGSANTRPGPAGAAARRSAPPITEARPTAAAPPAAKTTSAPAVFPAGEGEAALLERAQKANDAGDGVTALEALEAHERRFPAGLLAEQRHSERVVALCTIAKMPSTRERAEHFLAERPHSQQADRIRRACGLP